MSCDRILRCDWNALHSAGQQTAVTEVTGPLPSLVERGVATRDYILICMVTFVEKIMQVANKKLTIENMKKVYKHNYGLFTL